MNVTEHKKTVHEKFVRPNNLQRVIIELPGESRYFACYMRSNDRFRYVHTTEETRYCDLKDVIRWWPQNALDIKDAHVPYTKTEQTDD